MRRRDLLAAAVALGPRICAAQVQWRSVAVPYYTPPDFVQGQRDGWYRPRAADFVAACDRLVAAIQALCGGAPIGAARQAWLAALLDWARLSAVAVGPLIERRSARRIDFAPTRVDAVARAIVRRPSGEADFDTIGSAGKGFGALEQLLWPRAPTDAAACRYGAEVAADIRREAQALAMAFAAPLGDEEAQTLAAMSEAVNQWVGGIEQLRVQGLERPLREASARGLARPVPARAASGAGLAEREARWAALRALAVFEGAQAPAAGQGLVALEPYLRGKGLNPLADRLAAAARGVDHGLAAAREPRPERWRAAARSLAALRSVVETEVAAALDIRLGFSDADGD